MDVIVLLFVFSCVDFVCVDWFVVFGLVDCVIWFGLASAVRAECCVVC